LRREARGAPFDPQRFHMELMRQGTVPATYIREELLRVLRGG
jgi:hypothetical protein